MEKHPGKIDVRIFNTLLQVSRAKTCAGCSRGSFIDGGASATAHFPGHRLGQGATAMELDWIQARRRELQNRGIS